MSAEISEFSVFGPHWWRQPLEARFASIEAANAGLRVQIEMRPSSSGTTQKPCITWRGTSDQFSATKYFPHGAIAKSRTGRWTCPGVLRGMLYPVEDGEFLFVIEWCSSKTSIWIGKHARAAMEDWDYLKFREVVIGWNVLDPEEIQQCRVSRN